MSSLADGTVSTTRSELYEVFHSKGVRFEQINFFNDNVAAQTIIIYVKRNGSTEARKLRQWQLAQNEAAAFLANGETLTLSPGDSIEAETTTADAVDYLITGELVP